MHMTNRQKRILDFISRNEPVSQGDISSFLEGEFEKKFSRMTVIRDMDALLEGGFVLKVGKGRSVRYTENVPNEGLRFIDTKEYLSLPPDERILPSEIFNKAVFERLRQNVFTAQEIRHLEALNEVYKKRVSQLTPMQFFREFERFTIEFSWKSSQIEGNTYSVVETEMLIKKMEEAVGHPKEEAIMILNHKKVLDFILGKKDDFRTLALRDIEDIHALVTEGLGVERGLRKRPVRIVGSRYLPLDNPYRIRETMEDLVVFLNAFNNPFEKAFASVLLLSYIQPFEDGNKRTARIAGNAILMAGDACPISYRSVSDTEYKNAILLFYEQNNFRHFKQIFMEQFEFAVENYFL